MAIAGTEPEASGGGPYAAVVERVKSASSDRSANAGAFFLGFVLGFLVTLFATRITTHTIEGLVALVGILGGVTVVGLLDKLRGGRAAISWYLIGLGIGFVLYIVLAVAGLLPKLFPAVPQ